MRVLSDLNRQGTPEARIILGAAVFDDVLGVVLLAVLYDFCVSGNVNLTDSAQALLYVGAFLVTAPLLAKLCAVIIRRVDGVSGNQRSMFAELGRVRSVFDNTAYAALVITIALRLCCRRLP